MTPHSHLIPTTQETSLRALVARRAHTGQPGAEPRGTDRPTHRSPERATQHYWQNGYGAFSVSESNVGEVRQYVAGQREHHRLTAFQDEFRAFLEKHRIDYDEQYVWD